MHNNAVRMPVAKLCLCPVPVGCTCTTMGSQHVLGRPGLYHLTVIGWCLVCSVTSPVWCWLGTVASGLALTATFLHGGTTMTCVVSCKDSAAVLTI